MIENTYPKRNEGQWKGFRMIELWPWSGVRRCPFCGMDIVILKMDNTGGDEFFMDIGKHNDKCPLSYGVFKTEQEAKDSYNMRWKGIGDE